MASELTHPPANGKSDRRRAPRFCPPGARRIGSDSDKTIAFSNPDGSFALIAYNDTDAPVDYHFKWGGSAFDQTLPAKVGCHFHLACGGTRGIRAGVDDDRRQKQIAGAPAGQSILEPTWLSGNTARVNALSMAV